MLKDWYPAVIDSQAANCKYSTEVELRPNSVLRPTTSILLLKVDLNSSLPSLVKGVLIDSVWFESSFRKAGK
jgi:hypothetical protein